MATGGLETAVAGLETAVVAGNYFDYFDFDMGKTFANVAPGKQNTLASNWQASIQGVESNNSFLNGVSHNASNTIVVFDNIA